MIIRILIAIFINLLITSCNLHEDKATETAKKVISGYQSHIDKGGYTINFFFREKAMFKTKYVMYTDAVGDIVSAGYNCEIPVDNFSFLPTNMRKSSRSPLWLYFLRNLYAQGEIMEQSDVVPGYNCAFNTLRFLEEKGPLNQNNTNNYIFTEPKKCNTLSCILFKPNNSNDLENTNRKYKGVLYFDPKTLNLSHIIMDSCDIYSEPFRAIINAKVEIKFHYIDNICYPQSINIYSIHEDLQHWILLKMLSPKVSKIAISKKEYGEMFNNDISPYIYYRPEKWNLPIDLVDESYDKISHDLKTNDAGLEQQFKVNSEQYYLTYQTISGEVYKPSNKNIIDHIRSITTRN